MWSIARNACRPQQAGTTLSAPSPIATRTAMFHVASTSRSIQMNCAAAPPCPSGGVKCSKCNHERQFHRHYNSIWDTREVTELLVNPDKKAKFENAKGAKERAKQLEDQIMETKAKLQDRIRKATNDLGDLVERYSNLSLSGSFAGQVEKAVQMLEQNLQTMREGGASQQTIEKVQQSLNSMQAKLEVLKTTKREKDNKGTMLTTAAQNLRNYFWRSG